MSGNESMENGQDTRITSQKTREDIIDARKVVVPSFDASLSSSRRYLVQVHRDLFPRRKSKYGIIVLVPHNA
jgi:hypothetical protein